MKTLPTVVAFVCSLTVLSWGQDIVGTWNGKLEVNGADLRLVLHITRNADGALRATLDSIDQEASGIPVTSVTLKDSKLHLTVDRLNGTYEGTVHAASSEIAGTWTQSGSFPLNFHRGNIAVTPGAKPAQASEIEGDWLATLDTGMAKLRLALHIVTTEKGLTATMDSLDQEARGLPVTSIRRAGSSLQFEMKVIGSAYEGKINPDLSSFSGTWRQLGKSWPLVFKRVKNPAELERVRPQNPTRPFPYREEEVSYGNPAAKIVLAATLTIPSGNGPFPAVLLIAGSGPQDRDEGLMGHKPFLVLADYLTRKGIVVLRADKRGRGRSQGNYAQAVMADFASDAEAGIAYLKTRREVDPRKIGVLGHGEGAVEASMVAIHNSDVAFVVMMAGSGVPGDQLLPEQVKLMDEASGKSSAEIASDLATQKEVLAAVEKETDPSLLDQDLRDKLAGKVPDEQIEMQIRAVTSPWFRDFIQYDPATTLAKLTCPVLVINGEKDLQVPPRQNLPPIRKALQAAGNTNFEIDELPGLNHRFQTAKTGAVSEYSEIEETMSPVALDKITSWILKQASALGSQGPLGAFRAFRENRSLAASIFD